MLASSAHLLHASSLHPLLAYHHLCYVDVYCYLLHFFVTAFWIVCVHIFVWMVFVPLHYFVHVVFIVVSVPLWMLISLNLGLFCLWYRIAYFISFSEKHNKNDLAIDLKWVTNLTLTAYTTRSNEAEGPWGNLTVYCNLPCDYEIQLIENLPLPVGM